MQAVVSTLALAGVAGEAVATVARATSSETLVACFLVIFSSSPIRLGNRIPSGASNWVAFRLGVDGVSRDDRTKARSRGAPGPVQVDSDGRIRATSASRRPRRGLRCTARVRATAVGVASRRQPQSRQAGA